MQYQKDELLKVLPEHGWKITELDEDSDYLFANAWWLDEVLVAESTWSPVGLRAYIFFEIDPQCNYRERKKGEYVWAVSVSLHLEPQHHQPNSYFDFPAAKGHWKESLQDLIKALNQLRQTAVNETSLV